MPKQITHEEAEQLIANDNLIIADVRDYDSYLQEHINGAIHLSMSALQEFCATSDKDQAILLYCYHGISSQSVAQHLIDQGFSKVFSLIGGFEVWKEQHSTSDRQSK